MAGSFHEYNSSKGCLCRVIKHSFLPLGQSKMQTQPREGWHLCHSTTPPSSWEPAGSVELWRFHSTACVRACLHAQCTCVLAGLHAQCPTQRCSWSQPQHCYRRRQGKELIQGNRPHQALPAGRPGTEGATCGITSRWPYAEGTTQA